MIKRGNQKSFAQHPDEVAKVFNKEVRYSHILPLHDWACQSGPNLCCTTQSLVGKDIRTLDEKWRAIWDGTTILTSEDVVVNDQTPTENEADVTFGMVKVYFTGCGIT